MTSQNQKPRILQGSFEDYFVTDYLKVITDEEKSILDYISTHVAEDYPRKVGELYMLRKLEDHFMNLLKSYFPT